MSDQLTTAAAALGAPEELVSRSAQARAKADGTTVEAVLAAWSGGEAAPAVAAQVAAVEPAAPAPVPAAPPAAAAEPPIPADAPVAAIGPAGEIDWQAAAAAAGMPAKLLQRSVEAKASAAGRPAAEILAEMIGSPAAAPSPPVAAPAPPVAEVEEAATPVAQPAPAAPQPESEQPESEEPEPEPFESEEDAAAAGAIPRWLAAAFVLIPTIAVLYALFLPNGPNCGDAGSLAIDPVTGMAVNCDATPYGVDVVDFYAIGEAKYASCAACHGDNGGGAGNFPGLVGGVLMQTFPEGQCQTQVDWVSVGTTGWPDATYGATAKPVGGSGAVMPAFGASLSDQELRAVVLYERVRFGGQDLDAALADCGLADPGAGTE